MGRSTTEVHLNYIWQHFKEIILNAQCLGNTWAGGTGGRDTAGLGGKGGPYRLDAGNNVHQISDEEKRNVPEHIQAAAREMAKVELAKRMKEIDMAEEETGVYLGYLSKVKKQIVQLRLVLQNAEAKEREREWLRNQHQGDLDDMRLVDALTGSQPPAFLCLTTSEILYSRVAGSLQKTWGCKSSAW